MKVEKRNLAIKSDAFPPNYKRMIVYNEDNVKCFSMRNIHVEAIRSGIQLSTIEIDRVYFEQLNAADLEEVIQLHREWFPVAYTNDYFRRLFSDQSNNSVLVMGAKLNLKNEIFGSINQEKVIVDSKDESTLLIKDSSNVFIVGIVILSVVGLRKYWQECKTNNFKLVGNCCFNYFFNSTKFIYVNTLGVLDEFRRKGLAKRLFNAAIKKLMTKLESSRVASIYLHVVEYNSSASEFYNKLGFMELRLAKNYYFIKGKPYHAKVFHFMIEPSLFH